MSDGAITCGACGAKNPPGAVTCVSCGALLAAYQTPTGAGEEAEVPAAGVAPVLPPPASPTPVPRAPVDDPLAAIDVPVPLEPELALPDSPELPSPPVVDVSLPKVLESADVALPEPEPAPKPPAPETPVMPGTASHEVTTPFDPTEAAPDPELQLARVMRESRRQRVLPKPARPTWSEVRKQYLPKELGGSQPSIAGSSKGSPPQMIAAGVAVLVGSCVAFVLGGSVDGAGCFSGLGGIGLVAAFVLIGLGASGGLKKE